ncbi:baculoviral IAP repeat-containing protein 7-like [Mya arenaria]|uniref:baculoviral IAP repeat-containing protein 7-like n=1 Tax=Mya arenaria TaxID=6604 RepID=UPI0022E97D9F|nr:baculoviral IAP repeat-containing protein 7-like [Mya arenaria]
MASKVTPTSLGIFTTKPKFPNYAIPTKRLESFTESSTPWPDASHIDVNELVSAGLVYSGVGDAVRCYHCGGGLKHWEIGDDPMYEHARWFPTCPHIVICKGKDYVEKARLGEHPSISKQNEKVNQSDEQESSISRQETAMEAAAEFGYHMDWIRIAARIYSEREGPNSQFQASDLMSILMEMEDDPSMAINYTAGSGSCCVTEQSQDSPSNGLETDLEALQEENQNLKDKQNCKICLECLADVIFLPCGHIVTCPQCAHANSQCPICRKDILGLVKCQFADFSEKDDDGVYMTSKH